ncbi:TerC/Alx family metal homeostasis membrane protein [Vibrio metschnikovii]|uniref:TerC/Alx family metal homeostasis membrane protein n=1 Tax=Vibrio metschnikovii TaxID=28172 RepID=UPI001C2FAC38|nr:TerC/Alx family metal homeostasis membrane protein [Vibrio metschnikovii]
MTPIIYISFTLLTFALVAMDIWQTRGNRITLQRALSWSLVWILLAFLFAAVLYLFWDDYAVYSPYSASQATLAFLTGYLLEKSLSIDNLFVFAIIFHQYAVPESLRPRALLFGVIGALVLRAVMIIVGAQLLEQYHGLLYVFALFLMWTGVQLLREKPASHVNPLAERIIRRCCRVTNQYQGHALWVRVGKRWWVTPMLIVVGVIACMDVMFALDSIPAIFAVTREPFLVLAANVFALLGLRSLFFVLQGLLDKFIYLKPALAFIMMFIGVKMLLVGSRWEIPTWISLSVLLMTMLFAIIASLVKGQAQSQAAVIKLENSDFPRE